ncbi:MAG: nitroreductase family protein [Spirochaetes bacterium]|nr:nitroreductase family protein [Spirochaetota bacterium]
MMITRLDDRCSNCGLCARDCVMGVWRIVDGKPAPVRPDMCNRCSHCIAVCPRDAILHEGLDAAQAVKVNKNRINPQAYREIVMSRRSVRQYRDRPVPREVIEKILDLARYSPTASNDQNVGYIVVTDAKLIRKCADDIFSFAGRWYDRTKKGIGRVIADLTGISLQRYVRIMEYSQQQNAETGRDFILHGAPVLILVHAPARANYASDNCAIAATNIINYAHALGLGTCYIGLLTLALRFRKNLMKMLHLPAGRKVFASLVMGYPAYAHIKTVSRKKANVAWIGK